MLVLPTGLNTVLMIMITICLQYGWYPTTELNILNELMVSPTMENFRYLEDFQRFWFVANKFDSSDLSLWADIGRFLKAFRNWGQLSSPSSAAFCTLVP